MTHLNLVDFLSLFLTIDPEILFNLCIVIVSVDCFVEQSRMILSEAAEPMVSL